LLNKKPYGATAVGKITTITFPLDKELDVKRVFVVLRKDGAEGEIREELKNISACGDSKVSENLKSVSASGDSKVRENLKSA
ncbi:MAG: hypothetical protein RSB09_03235, partial [Clostridia bacterium]